jgi:hypothetical protein
VCLATARSEITSRWAMAALDRALRHEPKNLAFARAERADGVVCRYSGPAGGRSLLGPWPFHPRRPAVLPRRTGRCRTPGPSRGSRCHQSEHSFVLLYRAMSYPDGGNAWSCGCVSDRVWRPPAGRTPTTRSIGNAGRRIIRQPLSVKCEVGSRSESPFRLWPLAPGWVASRSR